MEKLEQFNIYLVRQGLSLGTVEKHTASLRNLISSIGALEINLIEKYIFELIKKEYSPGHINNLVQALRHYGEFTKKTAYKKIKYLPLKETHKATMSDKEIEAFLSLEPGKDCDIKLYKLFTLYFSILSYSGMRPGEVANLTIESVDFGRGVFDLSKTKTNRPRLVPIAPSLIDDLTGYIKSLPTANLFEWNEKLICHDNWRHQFNARIKRMGIKRNNLSTHSLRHSFITRLLSEDINIFKVQRIVGHKKIETTNHYTHLVTKDLKLAINKDPLSRDSLPYQDRFKQFREGVRKLLEDFTQNTNEERKMLNELIN